MPHKFNGLCCISLFGAEFCCFDRRSCGPFKEIFHKTDFAYDPWLLTVDMTVFDGSDRLDPT